jgi:hypothetical protein
MWEVCLLISADYFREVDVMLKSKLKAGNGCGIMTNGTSEMSIQFQTY